MSISWKIWRVGAMFAMAGVLVAGTVSAQTGAAAEDVSTIVPTQQQAARAAKPRPWTQEEMNAAKPYPVPEPKASAQRAAPPVVNKAGGLIQGSTPVDEPAATADEVSQPVTVSSPSPMGYSYPFPFTRYEIFTSYTASPYAKIGKLFFKQYGVSYVCSASSIGNRAIITAGHCLHAGNNDANGWSTNVVFVPAYKDGNAPKGQWSCEFATQRVFTAWYSSGSFNRDVAGCKLLRNSNGKTISQVVGSLGFAWNWGDNEHYMDFGYPQASPFNGKRLIVCAASFATWDTTNGGSPLTQGIGCDMTGGSSGGPWTIFFNKSGGYVNGVNSYKYTVSQPSAMYSPYFDDVVKTQMYDLLITP